MDYILALDPGGTKCDAILARKDGRVRRVSIFSVPGVSGRSENAIHSAAHAVLFPRPKDLRTLHVACVGNFLPLHLFHRNPPIPHIELHIIGEHEGPMALAGQDHAIVVLAGTGAFVHVRTRNGDETRLDGSGPLLGDHGSAYHIGRMALRAIAKASRHPRHKTSLQKSVFEACGTDTIGGMVAIHRDTHERSNVAALAAIVDRDANAGDAVAQQILKEAAEALVDTLRDALDNMKVTDKAYPLVGTGSVVMKSKIFWQHFCEKARVFAPNLQMLLSRHPPVVGMVMTVARKINTVAPSILRRNVLQSWARRRPITRPKRRSKR